jgi:hypothetical protein
MAAILFAVVGVHAVPVAGLLVHVSVSSSIVLLARLDSLPL